MTSDISFQNPNDILREQEALLTRAVAYAESHSAYYRGLFAEHRIDASQIQTLADLHLLPTTSKSDLQRHNDAFCCVPPTEIIDYATTSGTLGDPVTFGLTDADLDRLAYNEMQSFIKAGIKKGDVVQLMTTMDRRFMAGLAYFLGLRKLGAGVVRVGAGIPELQWDSILKYKPSYLISVPSFLLKLVEYAENNGIDYKNSSVRGAICIGEGLREQDLTPNVLAQKIASKWPIALFSTYASTEMSTAFTECSHGLGGHLQPDLIIAETLDERGNLTAEGQPGELVVTTLGVQAMPLLRFKTGDIVQLHREPCPCGRNTLRVGPVLGRKQQMIKYKGTTLYPPAMTDILNGFDHIELHLIEIYTSEIGTDEINIRIASRDESPEFLHQIKDHFRAKLRVSPNVGFEPYEVLAPLVFNPMSRKPLHFQDHRKSDV